MWKPGLRRTEPGKHHDLPSPDVSCTQGLLELAYTWHEKSGLHLVGEQFGDVVTSPGAWLALSSWCAAVRHLKARDALIGWTAEPCPKRRAIGWTRRDVGVHHALKMQDERRSPPRGQESAMTRRTFIELAALGVFTATGGCAHRPGQARNAEPRLLFTSAGKTCLVRADGTGLRTLEFAVPNQATWQPAGFFPDGRVLLLSMEPRRDGPGRPFAEYYHQTPTHLWSYDLERGTLTEIATRDRLAVFYAPALLLGDDRLLVQVVRDASGQIFSMNLDGSDAREFTRAGEGVPYGLSLSPDGQRVAYHLASPRGYEIWTSDVLGANRVLVAGQADHLYFGPSWSPDGQWLVYQDCHSRTDPGHDWSDVCLGRPDGSEHRVLTEGQAMWFGATYGFPGNRGGGSNVPVWCLDGTILFPRRLPGSKVPWEFQPQRPDTDHFNRDYRPELARGGTEIHALDPETGTDTALSSNVPPVWDFRCVESPDGHAIAFCRAETGGVPGLWVMNRDGSGPRLLTQGLDERGADHPRWLSIS